MGPKTTVDSLLLTPKLLFPENFPTPLFPEGEVSQESTDDLQRYYHYVKFFLKIGGHYHTAPQAVMKRNMKLQPLIEP